MGAWNKMEGSSEEELMGLVKEGGKSLVLYQEDTKFRNKCRRKIKVAVGNLEKWL